MDLSKVYEYFQPEKVQERLHIVGCGSVGSTVAENLARCGLTKFTLWDFDFVEAHNIANQMFRCADVRKPKVEALRDLIIEINPQAADRIECQPTGWNGKQLSGYIFLCVDDIELRRKIVEQHMNSPYVKAVFDFRTLLESAQHYAADWSDRKAKQSLLSTMEFTNEEANSATPVSACGVTLGVATTVRLVSAIGVDNFLNFTRGKGLKKMVLVDGFQFAIEAF